MEIALNINDQVVVNTSGTPAQLPMPLLRGLFSAGDNIQISTSGTVSASTDPGVTTELSTLSSGLSTTEANLAALAAKIP
jgi:hypothetical protein